MQTSQKVILITGSNSGIGHATARQAAAAGHIVYGGARRPETFPDIAAVGAQPIRLDVTDEASMVEAVRQIEERHGVIDVLVNNAGFGQMGPIESITPQQWMKQYQVNVFGLVRMSQLVIPAMRQRHSGHIINNSSMLAEFTFPLAGAYNSTKHAIESISAALRFELKPFGIRVTMIQPGPVRTPMAEAGAEALQAAPDDPYAPIIASFRRMAEQDLGYLTADQVAAVIVRAIQSPHPRPRYRIGLMANAMPLLRKVLPDTWWDGVVGSFYR